MNTRREMLKSWSQKGKSKLSNGFAFLGKPIFFKKSSVAGEATPETELTAPGADSEGMASRELIMSENDMAAVVAISGGASSPGLHPEPSTLSAAVGRAELNQFGGTRDSRLAGAGAGSGAGLGRLSNLPPGATQYSVGIGEQDDEEPIPDVEAQLGSNEDSDAPVSRVRAYLNFRAPLQAPYILFGLRTNITLALVNIKLIHELNLPGSTSPTLTEGVLAAAAGIGLLTSSSAMCLQVKAPRSGIAKVLSQMSVVILGSSLLVKLSTWFLFEQYMPVNIVTTALLFVFMVGVVIWAGISTAVS